MLSWVVLLIGGLVVGLITAAPVGAVNVICIRRTLSFGALNGFLAGLGGALGDATFAVLAAFGHSAIADFLTRNEKIFGLLGGVFLIGVGLYTFAADPAKRVNRPGAPAAVDGTDDLPHTIAATFALTITNPATFLAFTAIFAAFGQVLGEALSLAQSLVIVAAVLAGSALWWLILAFTVGLWHGQIGPLWLKRINRASGVLIALLGCVVLASAFDVL